MKTQRAIGFGCTATANVDDIVALVRTTLGEVDPAHVLLATIDRHASIGRNVADILGSELVLFSAEALSQVAAITQTSALALAAVGTPSVAEAAALAALGGRAQLTVPRMTGRSCTCAMAQNP